MLHRFTRKFSKAMTNQRVSCAFTCSPFSFYARYILPTSKFQHIFFTYFLYKWTACLKNCECEYSSLVWRFLFGEHQWMGTLKMQDMKMQDMTHHQYMAAFFCRWQSMRSSANFRTVFPESQNANPLDVELEPDFNAKWPFKVIQGHPFRCQWRATKGLHSTI